MSLKKFFLTLNLNSNDMIMTFYKVITYSRLLKLYLS